MARKRERVDLSDTRQLFKQRLSALLSDRPRPRNPALDLLTGAAPSALEPPPAAAEAPAAPTAISSAAPPVEPAAPRRGSKRPRRGGGKVARTVYLEADDLEELDALAREWSTLAQRRVSRSEVLRQAVRWLRGAPLPPPSEGD